MKRYRETEAENMLREDNEMKYGLCDCTWDEKEISAIHAVLESGMLSMGKKVREYEKAFAAKHGSRYAIMVNSGSSANLVAAAALVYSGKLKAGDEVLVPAVSWSTTYFPLYHMGLRLRFVDIDRETLNIDPGKLREAVTDRTKMVCAVNLLGNPCDYDEICGICDEKGILLMEDNCESLGAEYHGKKTGTFGIAGTFSSFYSHHLYTMEGGMVITDDEELYHYMLCIRAHGWTRQLPEESSIYQKSEDEFYEKFNFIVPGFNVRPIEVEAAAGVVQMTKMDETIRQRRENADHFKGRLSEIPEVYTQKETGSSSWFGFAVIFKDGMKGLRNQVVKALSKAEIEVRPIVAGNFTRNKAIQYLDYTVSGELLSSDHIHENGFFVGNYGRNNNKEVDYFIETMKSAIIHTI